ncbi:MAG: hypothetical protein HXS47_13650 [Theionarchaea archaeon]|nr:hypothetical protein [Theionarchaea archaeon]
MKYAWLVVVILGIAGIYLGIQRLQVDHAENIGRYPCFFCASVQPEYEIVIFSAPTCPGCESAVQRIQRFCRLTGVQYGGAYYDDAAISQEKRTELGLTKDSDFLVIIVRRGTVLASSTDPATAEEFLSETFKEVSQL